MENQTRFDLNAAMESWRAELAAQPALTPDARRELETHLQDLFAEFKSRGLGEEHSFQSARDRLGQLRRVGKEFQKIGPVCWNKPLAFSAWFMFVVSFFLIAYYVKYAGYFRGYECSRTVFLLCLNWGSPEWGFPADGLRKLMLVNWALLNLVNLLMITSPVLLYGLGRNAMVLKWFQRATLGALGLIGGFFINELIQNFGHACRPGCYLWILSFVLLYSSVRPRFYSLPNHPTLKRA